MEAQYVRHLLEWMEIAADHPPAGLQQRLHPPHKSRQIVKIMEAPLHEHDIKEPAPSGQIRLHHVADDIIQGGPGRFRRLAGIPPVVLR